MCNIESLSLFSSIPSTLCSTLLYSTLLYSTLLYSTLLCSTLLSFLLSLSYWHSPESVSSLFCSLTHTNSHPHPHPHFTHRHAYREHNIVSRLPSQRCTVTSDHEILACKVHEKGIRFIYKNDAVSHSHTCGTHVICKYLEEGSHRD
jgi:hypothetical protein